MVEMYCVALKMKNKTKKPCLHQTTVFTLCIMHSKVFSLSFQLQWGPAWVGRSETSIQVNYTDLRQMLLLLITWSTLFLIALFIALEQTHCTLVACDSKQLTTAFSSMLWIFTEVVYLHCCTYSGIFFGSPLLHGWCHVKLLLSQWIISARYNHAPCHVTSGKATYIEYIHMCLAVTCHMHFWQNNQDVLSVTVVTRELNGYQNMSQHTKLTMDNKTLQLLTAPARTWTHDLSIWSGVWRSNHWAIPTTPLTDQHGWNGDAFWCPMVVVFLVLVSFTPHTHNQHIYFWFQTFAGKTTLSLKTTGKCNHLVHFSYSH